MKLLLPALLLISLCSALAQERRVRTIVTSLSLEQRLGGKTEWQMVAGELLKITEADGVTKLFTSQQTIIEIPAPESVHEVMPNRTGTCLLLRVQIDSPSGGSNYSRLVRVSRDPKGRWTPQTVLPTDAPPMNEFRRWVSELGAVSDSGRMVLFKLGQSDKQGGPPYRMNYSWQTWLLDPPKKVSDGIRVPDDFDK